jgi:acid phosphatase family membrane protein YuiD
MPPIQPVRAQVIEKIASLQDSDLAELLKFIEFLQWRSRPLATSVLANGGIPTAHSTTSPAAATRQPRQPGSAIGSLVILADDNEHLRDFEGYMP